MRDKMRAKYHKGAMKMIRQLNKSIVNDELWRGRFVAMAKEEQWVRFSDNSGGILVILVRMYDKKTKQYRDYRWEYAPYFHTNAWHLSMDIGNTFVVEDINVWEEDPKPDIHNVIDYTKVKMDWEKLNKAPYAFNPWEIGRID